MADNRDKGKEVDESILEEPVPNINEPQNTEDNPENQEPAPEAPVKTEEEPEEKVEDDKTPDEAPAQEAETKVPTEPETPPVDPLKEFKAQQSEAQIQKARNDALVAKIDEANAVGEPTEQEMTVFVATDGGVWEDLTPFEQAQAKRIWKSEKKSELLNEAVKNTKDIDAFAQKVDDFIESTDGKPEFVKLSGHELEFRKYAMVESHRGTPIDVLLNAFLFALPAPIKKTGSLFEKGGGGEKAETPGKISDADQLTALRTQDPRAYKRAIKEGKVSLDV